VNLPFDYSFDVYELDTVEFPHDRESRYMHQIDEKVADQAAACLRANAPDLSWVYLEYTDDMGHRHGDSKELDSAVNYVDDQVGRIWDAIEYRRKNYQEDWLIIISTDHGREARSGRGHGGQSERERTTWIVCNAKNLNPYFHDPDVAIVDILPSIAGFMGISIPRDRLMEIDGVPFINKISISNPAAVCTGDSLILSWKPQEDGGEVRIWLATSNHFNEGGMDSYQFIDKIPLVRGNFAFSVKNNPSSFYKIVLEAPDNFCNRWIILKKNK